MNNGLNHPEKRLFPFLWMNDKKAKYSSWTEKLAIGIEIIAVSSGVFIALAMGFQALEGGNESGANKLTLVLISAPFLAVALVELGKVPVATAVYFEQKLLKKIALATALMLITVITFETYYQGLELWTHSIHKKINDAKEIYVRSERYITRIDDKISEEGRKKSENSTEFSHAKELSEIENIRNSYNADILSIQHKISNVEKQFINPVKQKEIDSLDNDIQEITSTANQKLELAKDRYRHDIKQIKSDLKAKKSEQKSLSNDNNKRIKELETAKSKCSTQEYVLFPPNCLKEQEAIDKQLTEYKSSKSMINNEIISLESERRKIDNDHKSSTDNIINNRDSSIDAIRARKKNLKDEMLGPKVAEKANNASQKYYAQISGLEKTRDTEIESVRERYTNGRSKKDAITENNKKNIRKTMAKFVTINQIVDQEKGITPFKYDDVIDNYSPEQIRIELELISSSHKKIAMDHADNDFIHRIAGGISGAKDAFDIPQNTLNAVKHTYIFSIALLIATAGWIFIMVSLSLQQQQNIKRYKSSGKIVSVKTKHVIGSPPIKTKIVEVPSPPEKIVEDKYIIRAFPYYTCDKDLLGTDEYHYSKDDIENMDRDKT